MAQNLRQTIPKPLLEDIVNDHCVPIIGAGFSRNANLPSKASMPLWKDLGEVFAQDMGDDFPFTGPIDAISAYEHEFGRVKLVEKLNDLLHVEEAKPGLAHEAFCKLPFQVVVTTNFDCLLEKTYDSVPRYCHTIIGEEELSINPPSRAVSLLKFHGDLHHPERLIVTEKDYDTFLDKYPLLSTFLSNLLISNTPLFIGYSLEDPDLRQIWQIIDERLGKLRRMAYTISLEMSKGEIRRFERRGVKVVNLKRSSSYDETLAKFFEDLGSYWKGSTISRGIPINEETRKELYLPSESVTRLCLFIVPNRLQSFYQKYVFPIAESQDFVPITMQDLVLPGDNVVAKEIALLDRAEIVVLDFSPETIDAIGIMKLVKKPEKRVLVLTETGSELPLEIVNLQFMFRPKDVFVENEKLLFELETWFKRASQELLPRLKEEPSRLLGMKEYRAAFISAVTLLESSMRDYLLKNEMLKGRELHYSLSQMLPAMTESLSLEKEEKDRLGHWIRYRNFVLHENRQMGAKTAKKGVNEILSFVNRIRALP